MASAHSSADIGPILARRARHPSISFRAASSRFSTLVSCSVIGRFPSSFVENTIYLATNLDFTHAHRKLTEYLHGLRWDGKSRIALLQEKVLRLSPGPFTTIYGNLPVPNSHNTGIRPIQDDRGVGGITNNQSDQGRFLIFRTPDRAAGLGDLDRLLVSHRASP